MNENSRFCPLCGRWLATLKENGRFDLAARASIFGPMTADLAQAVPAEDGYYSAPLLFAEGFQAECGRWFCRFRRWIGR